MTEPAPAPERCAPAALRRGDQRYATAAPVPRWLLVEQPGPWGRDALRESRLDPAIVEAVAARAAAAGVRVVLIRRPGRSTRTPRRWAYVDSRPGLAGIWWGSWAGESDLLDLSLDRPAGTPAAEPAYLVCAHGSHDACCAIRGRPVAAALAAHRPESTWECSHVGGDRFAANLVLLPHGLYYGHVTPTSAVAVVSAYEAGEVDPALLRGRSAFPAPVQAAQHHARIALGASGVDALPPRRVEPLGAQLWRVWLAGPDGPVRVTVAGRLAPPTRLTCSSRIDERVRIFELVSLDAPGS